MEVYLGLSGQTYNVGGPLSDEAEGAEGSICEIIGNNTLVAKIYHANMSEFESDELESKLKLMVNKKIVETQGVFSIAWPRDILYKNINGKRVFAGYIMRKVSASYNLSDLTHHNPDDPDPDPNGIDGYITWKEFIQAAYNLSRLVDYLHNNGIEIGDFNERNFLFDETTGGFDLIDCGAYGVFDSTTLKTIYPCRYSMPKYSAPEKILGLNISNPMSTDCFYLAIHIFHLLMHNSEPFGYKETSDGDPISKLREHIANGDCLYVKQIPGKILRKHSIRPGVLPDDILEAFNRTFNYTRDNIATKIKDRTTASEWCNVLEPYLTDYSRIKRCPVKKEHVYSSHLMECPWCNPLSVSDKPYELRKKDLEAAKIVIEKTNSIGKVTYTDDCAKRIKEASIACEGLTEDQKTIFIKSGNNQKLVKAIDDFLELQKVHEAADHVIDLINSIGIVTYTDDCAKRIKEASIAYDRLTEDGEAIVIKSGYGQKLHDAIIDYRSLERKAESKKNKRILIAICAALAIVILIGFIIETVVPSIKEKRSVDKNALVSGDTSDTVKNIFSNNGHHLNSQGNETNPSVESTEVLSLTNNDKEISNTENQLDKDVYDRQIYNTEDTSLLLEVGDSITFGNWNGQDLSWTVCRVKDDYAKLICDYCLDFIQYSATDYYYEQVGEIEEDKSKIRAWLSDFYNGNVDKGIQSAFTEEDKELITKGKWISPRNNDLHDYVYIPAYDYIKDKANNNGFKIVDTVKDKFFNTPAKQRGDGEDEKILYAWTLNESQDDDKIIIEPVGYIDREEGFSIRDLSGESEKKADKAKYNAVIPTIWVERSILQTLNEESSSEDRRIHYYHYDLDQVDGGSYNSSFGPNYWPSIKTLDYDDQLYKVKREFFKRLLTDPVMAVACLAYVDEALGREFTDDMSPSSSSDWIYALNNTADIFINNAKYWEDKVREFANLISRDKWIISIEDVKGGSISSFLMYQEEGNDHPVLSSGSYNWADDLTCHYLTFVVTEQYISYDDNDDIRISDKDKKLSFLIEFGFVPVLDNIEE